MASKKVKIVIIEDEAILAEVLSKKLETEGYEVYTAADGESGLELMEKENPDIILLDIVMPKMNGYEVLAVLQNKFGIDKMPSVIIISNSGQPVEIEKAKDLGAKDFIVKAQFTPEEVLEKVEKLTKLSKSQTLADQEITEPTIETKVDPSTAEAKILVIEDDQFLRDLLRTKLEKESFSVSVAIDGPTGLDMIMKEKPQVILLDIILPGIDGFEILRRIRTNSSMDIARIPIILLTNLGQEADVEKGRSLGADDYLIKSNFTIDEIIDKLRKLISSQK